MGHKVNPISFRLGITRTWQARWYADKQYPQLVQEDLKLRKVIKSNYRDGAIANVIIERKVNEITITLHTARPGIIIGKSGQRIDQMRATLEKLTDKKVRLVIQEIRQAELEAPLVAQNIADQIERRASYRRAMKQALLRTMQSGAKGIKVGCAGRLGGAEIARRETMRQGRVPLATLRADIDYGFAEANTAQGKVGIKVWIYKGDVFEEKAPVPLEEMKAKTGPVESLVGNPVEGSAVETIIQLTENPDVAA
ncbi:MAG: 30S ribosomal protein S3 [Dehalococcoidia bacterium]|nr:30S ribosomal protein S3 [Dehalococcoidia bacterium]